MENKMIVGNALEIGIQLEYVLELTSPSGLFNFIVGDTLIPGKGTVTDLYVVISSLKDSLNSQLGDGVRDIGNISLADLDFSDGAPENVIWLDVCELSDYGCVFWLGFDGDFERFFYSTDFEKTIQEKTFPRGTVETLINSLPDAHNLRINRVNDQTIITEVIV
ncbi:MULTISPECIES: immunity 42 family protein [Serratia]|uniref:immunity 42 family protein n=2 Tax=Serratia TaxID=613 RepID=UPI001EF7D5FC|nr:immunity 42 family protein [Serratia marcescens]MDX7487139.1 immunity 42 family protein [Serratia marcescens]